MAYTNFTHCTTQQYVDILYGGDSTNKAKIWFNDVEMQDFGTKCERITRKARIMPNDGNKVFTLSNFVSTELEIILHDVDLEDLVDQVKVSIGTIVGSDSLGDIYEYVPLGIFNIQDQPVVNDNKVTLKLRDNRVKFDFNYNGQALIEDSFVLTTDETYQEETMYYSYDSEYLQYVLLVAGTDYNVGDAITGDVYIKKGYATKREILEDICTQAGVTNEITSFEFEDDQIGVYDNSKTATTYICYLADQCGCTPTINRDGHLIFIDYNNLYTWRIPKSILPSPFEVGTPFEIQRVVYESGIVKFESDANEELETLYLDSNNLYIDRYEQVSYIYNLLNGFALDSVTTQKMLGNPAIDPYDLIEFYDDSDENETVIATTLANNVYTFNGRHSNTFSTVIGKEQRKENVTLKGEQSFEKWARTTIDNLEGTVAIQTGKVETLEDTENEHYNQIMNEFNNYATLDSIDTITTQVTQLQTDTYTKTQVQQIVDGTGVDGVTVSAVVSTEAIFDKDGMRYTKTDAPTSSLINYKGLEVDDSHNNEIFFSGYDDNPNSLTYGNSIVRTDNLTVTTYLQCANGKGRIEQFTDNDGNIGAGFFLT